MCLGTSFPSGPVPPAFLNNAGKDTSPDRDATGSEDQSYKIDRQWNKSHPWYKAEQDAEVPVTRWELMSKFPQFGDKNSIAPLL
jgi:hypothetical protein